ncbi:transcription initiation factor IID, 31kD subunit-domain-containing protein [Chytridium lagenaria]|nr:transcription initiation factor IID, 31kD subunit-domain-containing protein [Chytridium lagenaria]
MTMDIDKPDATSPILPPHPPASTLTGANPSTIPPLPFPSTSMSTSTTKPTSLPANLSTSMGEHQDPLSLPRDAKLVSLILQAMDIPDYDPRVLPQLLEFMHRYVLDVLADAQLFSDHAGRGFVEVDDVKLAVEGKEVLMEMALARNNVPLPLMQEKYGLRLPPERNCLTGVNFNIVPQRAAAPAEPTIPSNSTWSVPVPQVSHLHPEVLSFRAPPPMMIPTPSSLPAPMVMASRTVTMTSSTNMAEDDYDDEEEGESKTAGNGNQRTFKGEDLDFDI